MVFWVVNGIDNTFLFNDNARMVQIGVRWPTLTLLPWDRETGIIDTVARVNLQSRLVRRNIEPDVDNVIMGTT